jgi:uncharacterized YccA/Bax inhibitor family protein
LILNEIQAGLGSFAPQSVGEAEVYGDTLSSFNKLIEHRRLRINAVHTGLPGVLWAGVLVGAALSLLVSFFIHLEDVRLHHVMVMLQGAFTGLVVFLIAANDYPFRGEVSVGPEAYETIYQRLMTLVRKGS